MMQRNIREASSIINAGFLVPLITTLILAWLFFCLIISLASLKYFSINQQLYIILLTMSGLNPSTIAHLVATYSYVATCDSKLLIK